MGRKIEIYEAYLKEWKAKHPHIVEPEIPQGDALEELIRDFVAAKYAQGRKNTITHSPKFWKLGGEVVRLADGRVCEQGLRSPSGVVYAVFPSEEAWRAYEAPMSLPAFFEER